MFCSDTVATWQPQETDLRGFELRFLLRWWRGLAAQHGGTPPADLKLDPLALRPALGHLMTLEPVGGGQDFRFRLFGTNIAQHSGFDLTNRLVSEFPAPPEMVAFLLATYRAACRARRACPRTSSSTACCASLQWPTTRWRPSRSREAA